MTRVITGLERLVADPPAELAGARLGLLANQASVGPGYEHASTLIDRALPGRLTTLFGPQHGFVGEKQDNMVESDHGVEAGTGRRIFSLYGRTRKPDREMMVGLDVLLVDLVDVGTRVYTFAQTMAYCLEAAAALGLKVLVLDRPNPIGGHEVEGNLLKPDCASFVGMFPLPMRHGLTLGELARFMAGRMDPAPDLNVLRMQGWRRDMIFNETGLPWVMPSPNMPAPETAWLYPGQVLWEGTNVSEGRGTTRPFHLFGAPFIDSRRLKSEADRRQLPGVVFRAATFEPTFHKFQGLLCQGLEIHPLDPSAFKPYLTSLTLLEIIMRAWPDRFHWKPPPYEYEYERRPIDLILGDRSIREGLEAGRDAAELQNDWRPELDRFLDEAQPCLLY
ncbi:MAG: DUF1343 domain-containing protein [Proteobacteria bacterium]|nr:DUF1343 domain-containing protein [Pseudomonadota bacterium]